MLGVWTYEKKYFKPPIDISDIGCIASWNRKWFTAGTNDNSPKYASNINEAESAWNTCEQYFPPTLKPSDIEAWCDWNCLSNKKKSTTNSGSFCRNQIVFIISRLILKQTTFRLVPNQLENGKQYPSDWDIEALWLESSVTRNWKQRNWLLILVKPTDIRYYLPFFDWFGTKRNTVWFQINWKLVNNIWFNQNQKPISRCLLQTNVNDLLHSSCWQPDMIYTLYICIVYIYILHSILEYLYSIALYISQQICGTRYSPESLNRSENPGNP